MMEVSISGKRFFKYQFPAVLWALLIFVSSATPENAFPVINIWWLPKVIHVVYFFTLCFLVHRALKHQDRFSALSRWSIAFSLLITALYAVSDETHQMFVPGRHPEVSDIILDTVSGMLFVGSMRLTSILQAWKQYKNS